MPLTGEPGHLRRVPECVLPERLLITPDSLAERGKPSIIIQLHERNHRSGAKLWIRFCQEVSQRFRGLIVLQHPQ